MVFQSQKINFRLRWEVCFKQVFYLSRDFRVASCKGQSRLYKDIICSIISFVSKVDKILSKMRNNPRDWRIELVKTVARAYSIEWRQRGTSHVVFVRSDRRTLPVPAHRPIKPIYIKKFIEFVAE